MKKMGCGEIGDAVSYLTVIKITLETVVVDS